MVSFKKQSDLAKAKTTAYQKNYEWKTNRGQSGYSVGSSYSDYLLRKGFDEAYASSEGYAVRKNPITKENEMFVRGTAKAVEWAQNAIEAVPRKVNGFFAGSGVAELSFRKRKQYAKKLDEVARKERVKAVYGHSRGAAVVSDMNASVKKVGVDGAMLLAKKGRRNFRNYRQSQPFDWFIGRGEGRKTVKKSTWNPRSKRFHKVYK
jgi:hypothetical protein